MIWFILIYFDVFAYQNLANLIAAKIYSSSALLKSPVLIFRDGIPGSYFGERELFFGSDLYS